MRDDLLILTATVAGLGLLLSPALRRAHLWRATVTPLASIIGSGFLVLGPILNDSYGMWAPLVMLALCAGAWGFGATIRNNIARLDSHGPFTGPAATLERAGGWALALSYIVSVAYYLNLFGAFALGLTPWSDPVFARGVTTAVFALILVIGWTRGFTALERMEQYSVSLKLAIILGLLMGLALFFGARAQAGDLILTPPSLSGWQALTLGFGLIVTVQGFETSRYLGREYDAGTRIRSMKLAQLAATAIYMVYVLLLVFSLAPPAGKLTETAIIGLMAQVSPVLPALLVAAALAAQFSAAVADTAGAGGLAVEQSGGRIPTRAAYAVLVLAGVALTWAADVFQIIAWASRAFALYYAIEAALAAISLWPTRRPNATGAAALAALGLAIAIFGRAVE